MNHPHMTAIVHGRMHRRRMLEWLAGAGSFALLTGCGSDDDTGVVVPPTPTPTPSPSPSPSPSPTPTCTATAPESNGDYPADGSNIAPGATSNVLARAEIQRSDIRSSFLDTSTVAAGTEMRLTITIVDAVTCAPSSGRAVYIWQADAQGRYSLYTIPEESYLRGLQVTDTNGQVTFTTIVPGCLSGRYPHIYIEVFPNLFSANRGSNADLTTLLLIPGAVCTATYADTSLYPGSATNFGAITMATDPELDDNTAAENAARTLSATGSVSAGFDASITVTA